MRTLSPAARYALSHHGDQTYGREPYVFPYAYHLSQVVGNLLHYGLRDETLVQAAWLHDVVEDTDATLTDVRELFGEDVASLVWAVTGEGHNRKARNEDAYRKIGAHRDGLDGGAAVLKVADRLANVQHCCRMGDASLFKMYRNEHREFTERVIEPFDFDPRLGDLADALHEQMGEGHLWLEILGHG